MKKISKIMSVATSLIILSQSFTGAMKPSGHNMPTELEIFKQGYTIGGTENKSQLKKIIDDYVNKIKDSKIDDDMLDELIDFACGEESPYMCGMNYIFGISYHDVNTTVRKILNTDCNHKANKLLDKIVKDNETLFIQALAIIFYGIYISTR